MSSEQTRAFELPLFPLRTVLLPEGPLPLRVFEPRYLSMISQCLRNDEGFGVVLLSKGSETGPATFHNIGTIAKITDWYQGSDGILGVTAMGKERFVAHDSRVADDGLNIGTVERLADIPVMELPEDCQYLADILRDVLDDFGTLYKDARRDFNNADWVSCRLIEILPATPEDKQRCLECNSASERLSLVRELVRAVRGTSA